MEKKTSTTLFPNGFPNEKAYELTLTNLRYALKSLMCNPHTVMVRQEPATASIKVYLNDRVYTLPETFGYLKSVADQMFLDLFTGKMDTVHYDTNGGHRWFIWKTPDVNVIKWGTTYKQAKTASSCDITGLLIYFECLEVVERFAEETA